MTVLAAATGVPDQARLRQLFNRHGGRDPHGPARMRSLIQLLGWPQRRYQCIHITGTNGKTTTARMVARLLNAHGTRTGTFSSPHLQDVCERIAVDEVPISPATLFDFLATVDECRPALASQYGSAPSFFETMTALACLHFAAERIDTAVFEVGVGGGQDATKIVAAQIAIIGRVSLDHPELGSGIRHKAGHKAGIIADGATAVVGPQHRDAADVIAAAAARRNARLLRYGQELAVFGRRAIAGGQRFGVRLPSGDRFAVKLALQGGHHATNAALALAAVEARIGRLDGELVGKALAGLAAPGRGELVERESLCPVLLDGAHNPAAAACLARILRAVSPGGRVHVIVGIMSDKDVEGIVAALASVAHRFVVAPAPSSRAAGTKRLASAVRRTGHTAEVSEDVTHALRLCDETAVRGDLVVVTGSLYSVGAARHALGLRGARP